MLSSLRNMGCVGHFTNSRRTKALVSFPLPCPHRSVSSPGCQLQPFWLKPSSFKRGAKRTCPFPPPLVALFSAPSLSLSSLTSPRTVTCTSVSSVAGGGRIAHVRCDGLAGLSSRRASAGTWRWRGIGTDRMALRLRSTGRGLRSTVTPHSSTITFLTFGFPSCFSPCLLWVFLCFPINFSSSLSETCKVRFLWL